MAKWFIIKVSSAIKTQVSVFCLIASILFIVSCQNSSQKAPIPTKKPIISRDSMVLILKDLYLLEGAFYQSTIKPYIPSEDHKEYAVIFKKYGVSLNDFKSSLHLYQQDPKEMMDLYDDILEKISIEEAKLNTLPKP